ncbi:hypothetical protein XENOCAPTIV_010117 [Xenoophorus captivus]|uniref:Secreted protein n=1 Tax=Xenoophorus captivus TaxID=1517983 RepID=A0ABV0S653_9TELE
MKFLLFSAILLMSISQAGLHGGAVGGTVALQQEGPGFVSRPGVLVHGVCMFSRACVGSHRVLRLPPKDMPVRLIGHSKLPLGVCMSVCVVVCLLPCDGPVQGVPCLSPIDCWRQAPAPLLE